MSRGTFYKWLDRIWKPKQKCLICEEVVKASMHRCTTPGCNFVYCRQCWRDLEVS